MLRITVFSMALVFCGLLTADTANAQWGGFGRSHLGVHQDLQHNEFHRQQYHALSHQYPMTGYQHFRLHQDLNHDRFHDAQRHQRYHYYRRPSIGYGYGYGYGYGGRGYCYPGSGIGISRGGFSLRIGF